MANTFPALREFEKGPVSEAKALELINAGRTEFQLYSDMAVIFDKSGPGSHPEKALAAMFAVLLRDKPTKFEAAVRRMTDDFAAVSRAPAARKWLRERGVKDVDAMPALQASYLASWLRFRDRYDDIAAAMLLPTREAVAEARRAVEATDKMRPEVRDDPLAQGLLTTIPALEHTLLNHVRVRRQVAAVRAIEAIRAHLAASGGKLPVSWNEVTVVPVPDDPLTGKPFAYALKDGKATITAPPPQGVDPNRSNNFRYELTVRPMK